MSNASTFMQQYVLAIQNYCNQTQQLRQMNDQLTQDPTLITRYFTITDPTRGFNEAGQVPRKDIVAQDVTNAEGAVTQMLFTYDSGAPTQKSYLFKMWQ